MNNPIPIRILHLEDSFCDAELIANKLEIAKLNCTITVTINESEFNEALQVGGYDLIICDHNLVDYDGITALSLARRMHPLTPVILISGSLGDEDAVKSLQHGATDYLLKQKLERLPAAVRRALSEAESHRRHQQTQERNKELASLLNKAQDAIYVRDMDQHITYWNQGAERLYGWAAEEVLGKRAIDLFYRQETPQMLAIREAVLTKGEWMGELGQLNKEGKEVTVMARRDLMRDEHGNPTAILNINTDITERKKLETQLARARRAESVVSLASGVARDLNNALNPILMATDMLRRRYPQEKDHDLLDAVALNAERGYDMAKQLQTFAEGVAGDRLPIQSRYLFEGAVNIIDSAFEKDFKVQIRVPTDLNPILGDTRQLHRVLLNLCFNAREAMPNGGTLTLEAENVKIDAEYAYTVPEATPGLYVLWSISDTGIGIQPEILERIFDPFFSTKSPDKSTGLGLSTIVGIIKSHSGFIQVYSTPGQGSTFAVYLPAHGVVEQENKFHPDPDDTSFYQDEETEFRDEERAPALQLVEA